MMRVAVYGLWHLGCVTAACLAKAGVHVVGIDPDAAVVAALSRAQPPIEEPGLTEAVRSGLASGVLRFTTSATEAFSDVDVIWVTFDTPVNDADEADVASVRARLDEVASAIRPDTVVMISSQVPAGFTRQLADDWRLRRLHFVYSPENLRLGKAIESFTRPARWVVGADDEHAKERVSQLLVPYGAPIEWMSIASAEMAKHALNAFLATSVSFINEIARVAESVGADAADVERALKTEPRIGPKAYLKPGGPFAGGTLARDLHFLAELAATHGQATPLIAGAIESNDRHRTWLCDRILREVAGVSSPVVTLLGLVYRPDTSTLRRSLALEVAEVLHDRGVSVHAHDPAVSELPAERQAQLRIFAAPQAALAGSDLAVVTTEWPAFRALTADDIIGAMRRPWVLDPGGFLARSLERSTGVTYMTVGRT